MIATHRRGLSLLALFLLIVGVRFEMIDYYGSALPLTDQWDAEGWHLLKPWEEGNLRFTDLFAPHNEHRIFLTRILALGLYIVTGQWNPLLEMVAGAILYSLVAVATFLVLVDSLGVRPRSLIFVVAGLVFLLPFAWENTLGGFQSQFYFLIGLSLVALWGLGIHRALSVAWWMGLGGAIFACLAMGSGFFAAACVLALTVVRVIKNRRWSVDASLTVIACSVIVAIGCLTRTVAHVNESLQIESAAAFVVAAGRYLAWPLTTFPWMAVWTAAPLLAFGIRYLRNRSPDRRAEMILLVGSWWLLQVLALAYARGAHQAPPASRYTDVLAIGLAASLLALWSLITGFERWPRVKKATFVVVWAAPIIFGLMRVTTVNFRIELPAQRMAHQAATVSTQAYLRGTDNDLSDKPPDDLPYPDVERLKMMLGDPTMRSLLQANSRPVVWVDRILQSGWILIALGVAIMIGIPLTLPRARDV